MSKTQEHIDAVFADRLSKDNSALLLVDHQTGLANTIRNMSPETYKNNALALAKLGIVFNLPVILSTSAENGPNGPTMPEIKEMFPNSPYIARQGEVNAWDSSEFRKAVIATGKKKLIISGISTDVCVLFPSLAAVSEGYDVYAVIDSSGTWSHFANDTAVARMVQAGVKVTSWMSVAAELQRDWRNPTGEALAELFKEHLPAYGNLINSLAAVKN